MSTETGLDAEGLAAYRRENDRLRAERDALKAAIERVRELRDQWATAGETKNESLGSPIRAAAYADVVAWLDAALDASQRPEDATREDPIETLAKAGPAIWASKHQPTHVDRHGRSWDPHPFVQSRAVDNVGVCICGLNPDHPIHHRAPESPESEETPSDGN